jgi:hypothetical protein
MDPLIKHVISVCIRSIIPIANGCLICVNIVLDKIKYVCLKMVLGPKHVAQ